MSAPSLNRINVVFLYAEDAVKLKQFYESAFDLGKPIVDAKWWTEYAAGDGTHLAIHQADASHFEGVNRGKGTVKFSFDVSDIQAYTAKLKALGAKFHYEPRKDYGFYLAEFEDLRKAMLSGCTKRLRKLLNAQHSTLNFQRSMNNPEYDLEDRLLESAALVIRLVERVPRSAAASHVTGQLLRSCTSPLSNHGEAQAAESIEDFVHKLSVCLKEFKESRRRLRLMKRVPLLKPVIQIEPVLQETEELIRIFAASLRTARKRQLRNKRPKDDSDVER